MLSGIEVSSLEPMVISGWITTPCSAAFRRWKSRRVRLQDFENGMITFTVIWMNSLTMLVNDIEVVDGDVCTSGLSELWVYDVASEDFGLIEDVPSFISVGRASMSSRMDLCL